MRGTVLFFDIFSDRTVRLSREPVPLFKAILHGKYSCKIAFFIPETNFQMEKALITLIITTFFLKYKPKPPTKSFKIHSTNGWRKGLKGNKTISSSGIYNYGGIEFPFTAIAKTPNKYKFIVPLNGKYCTKVFNGKTG